MIIWGVGDLWLVQLIKISFAPNILHLIVDIIEKNQLNKYFWENWFCLLSQSCDNYAWNKDMSFHQFYIFIWVCSENSCASVSVFVENRNLTFTESSDCLLYGVGSTCGECITSYSNDWDPVFEGSCSAILVQVSGKILFAELTLFVFYCTCIGLLCSYFWSKPLVDRFNDIDQFLYMYIYIYIKNFLQREAKTIFRQIFLFSFSWVNCCSNQPYVPTIFFVTVGKVLST